VGGGRPPWNPGGGPLRWGGGTGLEEEAEVQEAEALVVPLAEERPDHGLRIVRPPPRVRPPRATAEGGVEVFRKR